MIDKLPNQNTDNTGNYKEIIDEINEKMNKAVTCMNIEFSNIHTGRATTTLVDNIVVDCYETQNQLNLLANITCPEVRMIIIQPYDISIINNIKNAILKANLGVNPISDGKILRLPLPELSEERRLFLVKQIIAISEKYKVNIRNIRREYNDIIKKMEKDKVISKDSYETQLDEIQKLTNQFITNIDNILNSKKEELINM